MKLRHFALLLVVIAAIAGFFLNALTALADEDGMTPLFNGKDLTGWKTTGNWLVEKDGVLAIKPREGETGWQRYSAYLFTEKQYDDFVLDLEFKIPPKGNSGIFFNIGDMADPVKTGIEVQILDSYGVEKELGHHDNGGVIRTRGPSKNASKPAGEWNRMVITCRGDNLKVTLNGEQIHDFDLSKEDGTKDTPKSGHIALQDHGLPLWFRNIKIKEL